MTKEQLATELHILLCKKSHVSGECQWYSEEQFENTWMEPSHKEWFERAKTTIANCGTILDVEIVLKAVKMLAGETCGILYRNPSAGKEIVTLISLLFDCVSENESGEKM